tara:strand:- start:11 stop:220 length:210 start_codon:yes stop_codon:yes gene_type:complete
MKKIEDNIEELFKIYKNKFGFPPSENLNLRKEFNIIIKQKIDYMPYWFVLKLIELDYDIIENDEILTYK